MRARKIILILLFIGLLVGTTNLTIGQDECTPQPPDSGMGSGPAGEAPDDSYSFSSGIAHEYNLMPEAVILTKGYWGQALKLYGGLKAAPEFTANALFEATSFLIIPTGGLIGMKNDTTFKIILQEYVRLGGTIIVFAQQYGEQIDNVVPIPEGESLSSYGWREDQSCFNGSLYFKNMHPVLSSQHNERTSAGVDGYFTIYPSTATVLLRKITNQEPTLLYYPYGQGTVILTSMFTDWGLAHSQASADELRMVRDLVTFAKNPNLAIPMYDLTINPTPEINLQVKVKNNSESAAAKVKLIVYSPNRKRLFYESEASLSLESGLEAEAQVSFTLPEVTATEYGIGHVDFELYDSEGSLIQLAGESDSGRFSYYKVETPYVSNARLNVWLTVEKENLTFNEKANVTLHFRNNTQDEIRIDAYYGWNHYGNNPLGPFVVPPLQTLEESISVDVVRNERLSVQTFFLWYKLDYETAYRAVAKGLHVVRADTESSIRVTGSSSFKVGTPVPFSFNSKNSTAYSLENTIFKVILEKWDNAQKIWQEMTTIHETVHNFEPQGLFHSEGTFTPAADIPAGSYRLRLEVERPDKTRELKYGYFSYLRSSIGIPNGTVPGAIYNANKQYYTLLPGNSYLASFIITNQSKFAVTNGAYVVIIKNENGQEAFKKETTNIALAIGESKAIEDSFVFQPPVPGIYRLIMQYRDETGAYCQTYSYKYNCGFKSSVSSTKQSLRFGESLGVDVELHGAGTFVIKTTCDKEGFVQEKMVQLTADNNYSLMEHFDMPLLFTNFLAPSMPNPQRVDVDIQNQSPYCDDIVIGGLCRSRSYVYFKRIPIGMNYSGAFAAISARVGDPLAFTFNIQGMSAFIVPISGELKIEALGLNYSDTQTVTINPIGDNLFTYSIPLPDDIAAGAYTIASRFSLSGINVYSGSFSIQIPAPGMKLSEPPATVAAGAALPLDFVNDGGKDGNYTLELTLRDEMGKVMLTHAGTQAIAAGATYHLDLTIPDGLKSGKYTLKQAVGETVSGKSFALQSGITLNGLTATLNVFTLKPAYFDNETVAGKAEIVAGGAIDNGKLKAKIVKSGRGGITVSEPGRYAEFSKQEVIDGQSVGNEIYFVTGTGLIALDRTSGKQKMIYEGEGLYSVLVTTSGELWLASNEGVKRRKADLNWITYTTADGLLSDNAWGFVEKNSDQSIWMATSQGVSVFKNEAWSSFTTVDGLSSNYIWGLVEDSEGVIWVYSEAGLDRYNGSGFENVDIPFNPQDGYFIEAGSNGDIWSNTWDSTSEKIWRYTEGNWTSWDLSGLAPDSSVYDMAADDGEMWFSLVDWSSNEYFLMKFDGTFAIIQNTAIPLYTIIPDPGQSGIYIGSFPGYVELSAGSLTQHVIEIDKEKLLGEVTLLAADGKGGTWAASMEGISYFNGSSFTHYLRPDIDVSWNINAVAASPDGTAYAVINHNLLYKIDQAGLTAIPSPEGIEVDEWTAIGLAANGRLWLIQDGISDERPCIVFYYDGAWHDLGEQFDWITNVRKIISDGSGGVWISWGSGLAAGTRLVHVGNDFSTTEYSTENSDLAYDAIEDTCLDANGVLWILSGESYPTFEAVQPTLRSSQYYREVVQTLQNGTFTLKASKGPEQTTPGYPDNGIYAILEASAADVFFAGADGGNAFHLYRLGNDELTASEESFYSDHPVFASSKGMIYAGGDIETSGINNLLQIGSGLNSVQVWSSEYPVNAIAGAELNLDLLPAKTLEAGNYKLSAELSSALEQKLASSDYGFLVRGTAVATSISRSGSSDASVRNSSDAAVRFEVLNSTAEDKPALTLKVSKMSPSGVETVLQDGPLSLTAGQSHAEELTFNESENGVWKLAVIVSEAGTTLDSAELLFDVSEPAVTYEIVHPEYAGDESFPVKIKLSNSGKIATNMHVTAGAVLEPPNRIDEDVVLVPGEERMLSFSDTITADRVYDIAFSGDLTINEQKTVAYGYVGNVALSVLPQYREGSVTMGYTVANSGGLPFSDTLHFGIFLADTETAVFTFDKTYNLYPAAEAISDALEFPLVPGPYQLRWTSAKSGSGQANFAILPAGSGQLAFAPAVKYPVGLADFAYTLTNTDTVAGKIDLLIEIVPAAGGAPVYTLNRSHYLEAGANISDTFSCDFAGIGSYIVRISGVKVVGGTVSVPVKVLNLDEVTTSVVVQPASNGTIPVLVNIVNSGYNDFAGTLVIEAGGLRHEEPLAVLSEATLSQTYGFDANGLTSGSHEVRTIIYDAAGNILSQNTLTVAVSNADIKVSEVPQNLTIAAGSFANVTLKIRNDGNKRGEAEIALTAFDTLRETRILTLEAGEEMDLSDIFIDVDGDIPAGRYPCDYTLSGLGVANGLAKGNFTFQVTGIALNVSAALDRSLYNQGETAQLTIDISANDPVTAPLEAVVNWNDFSERRSFSLDNGSSSLVFEIPLAKASDAKVFYGIYQQEGRGIYLNDIYLNFAGGVSVTLDQQVYAPGDSIHALFAVSEAGSLTAECFGQSQTIAIGTSGSISFAVPVDALGGSYGVAWTFTPADTTHESSNGSKTFDVSGLVVKVAKAELERGKYAPGDVIKAMLNLESNRDISLSLRSWTVTPEAAWTYLGEQSIALSATQQTPVVMQYTFATSEAGTHRFVYGLYNGEQLVVSGAAAFDCGDAVLIGLACDRLEYPLGSETVKVKADHFGIGTATLQLFLDDVVADEKSIALSGLGSTAIDLTAAQVSGGRHNLRAVMTKDGLTSTRSAWFTYGTSLPDLAVGIAERSVSGLDYAFTVQVVNSGKTAAPATTLVFSDNGTDMQSAAIAALAPGAAQDAQFTWSGSGKAGSHALAFVVDRDNAIKEFAEGNNVLEITEEVPALFYKLEIDPQVWTANRTVSIFSRFINNQAGDLPLTLHLTLTHNASSQIILDRNKNISLVPFVQTVETDLFQTGTYPAGDYTLAQTASGGAVERTEELAVYIEPTKAISATMSAVPTTVAAGADSEVTLKLSLRNEGNVALSDEALTVEVTNEEGQEVKTDTLSVSLAQGESKAMDHILSLNLAEGAYTITLKHGDSEIAETAITAMSGMEKEKYVSRRPRLLFMNTQSITYNSQKNFLKAILNAAGILYQDSGNFIDSYAHEQKSEHNINIVFGKLATQSLKKELKERVHRGEGLIHIVDNPASDAVMEELSGVRAHNLLPALREKAITLLQGILGGGGSALLKDKCKLGLEMLADDVLAVVETKNGKKPLAAYRPYGNGKVLTISLPLEFTSGGGFAQLLLNAVQLLNNDVFSPSDLARVLPLELRIKNNTGAAKTFRVQELIPQAANAYGFIPQPLEGDGVKWDIQLAVDEEKTISYWLRLPDAIGTFDVRSEIFDGAQKVDEALLTFEVGQRIADRAAGIAAEIAAGDDSQAKQALPMLQRIASRSGEDPVSLLLNLVDAVQAADLVAASATAEAMAWRRSLQDLLVACARMFYDKVKDFTPLELNAFGTRFQE